MSIINYLLTIVRKIENHFILTNAYPLVASAKKTKNYPSLLSTRYTLFSTICIPLFVLLFVTTSHATVNISGGTSASVLAGNPYTTLSAAVNALNSGGTLTAPVFVDVTAGHTEVLTARITLTMTGTAANPITIQKSGIGTNPVLFSFAGTASSPSSNSDGMFAIAGADYVTIDGIDLRESSSNLSTTTVMEFGYGLFKTTSTNGAQNNTIKNCTIRLNRMQNNTWTGIGHTGSIGIIMNNTTSTSSVSVSTSTTSGSNSFNKFYSNTISNCNAGIALIGFSAVSPFTLADFNNDIGGNSLATGNTIFDFGGAASALNQATGIFIQNQQNVNCSFNNIQNNIGTGVNHVSALRGIYTLNPSMSASADYTNNFIRVKGGGTAAEVSGISITHSAASATGTVNVNQNDISGDYLTVTTGVFQSIYLQVVAVNLNVVNNNLHDMSISNQQPTGMGGFVYGIWAPSSAQNMLIYNNTLTNITGTGLSGYTTAGILTSAASNQIIRKNQLNNISIGGSGTFSFMQGMSLATASTGSIICDSNIITGIYNNKTTGNGTLNGISLSGTTQSEWTRNNSISNLSNAGTGFTYGLNTQMNSSNRTIANNSISGILSAGTSVAGLYMNASTAQVFGNKIYQVTATSSGSPLVAGILLLGGSNSSSTKIFNNLVGLVYAPNANTVSAGNPTVNGIRLDVSTLTSSIELSFNSIYLDAFSSGTNFSSAGVYQTVAFNALPTTSNLIMRNNLIYNNSTPSGFGLTTAYQRSSSNKSNYNANSNRNLFYAGIPSANRLIYTDTLVFNQTLSSYQTTMLANGADQQSYDGAITFQSIIGLDTNFLKYDTSIPSLLESRGSAITGISTDHESNIRQGNAGYTGTGSAPDIGAWELNGQVVGGCSGMPSASNALTSNANPPCNTPSFTLSLDVTYGLGIIYQWEESTSGPSTGFVSIAGAINPTHTATSALTKWYRCVITCLATSQSITSGVVAVGPSPLSGNYLIDNTGAGNYTNFYDAITDLACKGISGPVVFNVSAGQVFNETNNLICTQTGTAVNNISFQKFGTGANPVIRRTGTPLGNDYVLKLEGVDYYTFDGINIEQSGTASSYVEFGIYITANPNDGARYNTFKNGVISTTTAITETRGVFMQRQYSATTTEGTNSYNRFLNMTVQQCFSGYYFSGYALDFKDLGNEINTAGGGISLIQNLGSATVNGSMIGVYTDAQFNFILQNTEVKNIISPSGSLVNGISISGGDSVNISNNSVHDITTPTSINGITVFPLSKCIVSNNLIYNLYGTGTSNAVLVKGLNVAASNPGIPDTGLVRVFANKIYHLSSLGNSSSQTIGMILGKGQPLVYNNMVSDLKASFSGYPGGAYGVFVGNLETNTICKLYYNTIYLDDSSSNALYSCAGILSPSLLGKIDMRNNVVVNVSNVTTGTRAVALMKNNTTDIIDTACNHNLWYAGTPGPKNLLYYDGTNSVQSLSALKALSIIIPAESNSVHENVIFQLPTNGILRPNATIPTRIESGGQIISGISTDFENDTRNPLTPDLGADEGIFTPGIPDCNGNPVASIALSNPSLVCPAALFTLSLNINFGFDYSFQWESSTTGPSSGYTAIPGAVNATYSTSTSVNRWYRCIVTCNQSGLSTPSSPKLINLTPLAGTYLIDNTGAGQYLSFSAAINDINCKGISGPVVFNVTAGQVFNEPGNMDIGYSGTALNTITFQKLGNGSNPKIQSAGSSLPSDYMIRINGADFYTFDGIDFQQTGTSSANYIENGIQIINISATNGSSNNTFKNGVITLTNLLSNTKGVFINALFTPTNASGANSYNRFINMTVQNAFEGYRITGSINFPGVANEINQDTSGNPTAVSLIQQIGNSTINAWATGVYVDFQTNFILANTEIRFLASAATVNAIDGIRIATSSANTAKIINNRFHHFTAPGSILAISVTAGLDFLVSNNQVFEITSTATGTTATGISMNASNSLGLISNNRVYSINNSASANCSAIGIIVLAGTNTLLNNMVSEIHAPNSTLSSGSIKGISIMGATTNSTVRLYYNTVYLNDIGAVANYSSAGIFNGSTVPNLDFRNNVVVNNCNVTVGQRAVAFWKTSTVDNIDNASNNNLWYAGVPGSKNLIFFNGTNVASTLAQYLIAASIAPADANAATENVAFLASSNGILRPNPTVPTVIEGSALVINGFNTDFENDNRHVTAPDRGADEGNFISNNTSLPSCATNLQPAANSTNHCSYQPLTLSWNSPSNAIPVNAGYDIYFGTNSNPPLLTNVSGFNYTVNNLLPNTMYYWKVVPKNTIGDAISCLVLSFTTTDLSITSTTPDTVCGLGMVTLNANGSGNFTWYDAAIGGNIIAFSNPLIDNISASTTYYVESSLGNYITTVGRAFTTSYGYTNQLNSGLVFDAYKPFTLQSVDIYTQFANAMVISVELQNNAGVVLQSATVNIAAGPTTNLKTLPLNFYAPQQNGLRLVVSSSIALVRENSHSGFPYPMGVFGNITGGLAGGIASTSYINFYNWKIITSCTTPRMPVTALVTTPPPLTISPANPVTCQLLTPTVLNASSTYPYTYYYWSPASNLVGGTGIGATVSSYNISTTIYTVTATDGNCTRTKTVMHTVNANPQLFTYSNTPLCTADSLSLSAYSNLDRFYIDTITNIPFIDISSTGTSVGTISDNSEHYVVTPHFQFANTPVNSIRISNNGIIAIASFGGAFNPLNIDLPNSASGVGDKLIAPYWDDLDVQASSSIKTQLIGSKFIIQFSNQTHHNLSSGSITYQVQIDTSNQNIAFVYQDVDFGDTSYSYGKSATIGIQIDASTASKYSFDQAKIQSGKSILFVSEENLITYSWVGPNGFTSNAQFPVIPTISAANAGTYSVTATSVHGCNSTATRQVDVLALTFAAPETVTTCGSYFWNKSYQTYTQSGTYFDTTNCLVSQLNLTILPGSLTIDTITSCGSYYWPWIGVTYTVSGLYGAYNPSTCDTIFIQLTILQPTSSSSSFSACNSYTWPANGITYTQSGTYQTTTGCHTQVLNLSLINGSTSLTNITACNSYLWAANGVTYTQSGTYNLLSGCDSLVLHLTIQQSSTIDTSVAACNTYTWPANSLSYTASGIYSTIIQCDTLRLFLTILPSTFSSDTILTVNSYTWSQNGSTYTQSGIYTHSYIAGNGCLHTSTLYLTIVNSGITSMMVSQDQPISCFGFHDGSCQAVAFPAGNYIYTLDGGVLSNPTGFFLGLAGGVHTVCASDGLNTYCDTVYIHEPDTLTIAFVTDSLVSCQGNDGALSVNIQGGTNILQNYLTWWRNSNGDTINNVLINNFATSLNGLAAGTYSVTVEDDHGCFATSSGQLAMAAPINVSASHTPIACFNGLTTIAINAIGGVNYAPLSITINSLSVSNPYPAGSYTIVATDAKACSASTSLVLTQPSIISNTSIITACSQYVWNGITYTASGTYSQTFVASNGCDSMHQLTINLQQGVRLSPKVLLNGAYIGNGMMHDSLRALNKIPFIEPYTTMNFMPIGSSGGETVSSTMLAISGNDAVVDWVHVEIRSGAPSFAKVATMNALLQRDGDVVDVNGLPLYFPSLCPGAYHIALKHRNHLGVMTATTIHLIETSQLIDFTTATPVWNKPGVTNTPRKMDGSYQLLWSGDTRTDKNIKYNGSANDKDPILYAVGNATPNNILYPVYRPEDANMDARVKYNNVGNDKNHILHQVFIANPSTLSPNAVISQHTPD